MHYACDDPTCDVNLVYATNSNPHVGNLRQVRPATYRKAKFCRSRSKLHHTSYYYEQNSKAKRRDQKFSIGYSSAANPQSHKHNHFNMEEEQTHEN
jgi:hypothetical protein